jgi:electron transport complex protein RnfC
VIRASGQPPGLRLDAHKSRPFERSTHVAPAPAVAILALDQGAGEAARPVVAPGDRVRVGTPVACAETPRAVSLHATVSGVVSAIGPRPTLGGDGPCIVIENDGLDEQEPGAGPLDWAGLDPRALIAAIDGAGIAGLGGAAYPTARKLARAREASVELLLLNAAECEPWICCDDALLRLRATDVVEGARVMLAACGADRCTIAIEDDKPDAAAALARATRSVADPRIEIAVLPALYPLGAERQLIQAVTGREVPSGAFPPAAGVLCQNVGTAAAIAAFVRSGHPPGTRLLTVTGSALRAPANVEARFGTPVAELLELCGGLLGPPECLIAGGSMTGRLLTDGAIPTTRGLNCVIAATAADLRARGAEIPCIRCGDCASVCPANLLPQQLHRAAVTDDRAALARYGLRDCIECGCCDYVCPSRIPLTRRFGEARMRSERYEDERRRAAVAKLRFARHAQRHEEQVVSEREAFEDARRRARGAEPERQAHSDD